MKQIIFYILLITLTIAKDTINEEKTQQVDNSFKYFSPSTWWPSSVRSAKALYPYLKNDYYLSYDMLLGGSSKEIIANTIGAVSYQYSYKKIKKYKFGVRVGEYTIYSALSTNTLIDSNSNNVDYKVTSIGINNQSISDPFVIDLAGALFGRPIVGYEFGYAKNSKNNINYHGWYNELIFGIVFAPYSYDNVEIMMGYSYIKTFWILDVKASDKVTDSIFKMSLNYRFTLK